MHASIDQTGKASDHIPAKHEFITLCGRIFLDADPRYFPSARHRGRRIWFCTDSCLGAFLSDPEVFYKVHRNSEKGKTTGSHEL